MTKIICFFFLSFKCYFQLISHHLLYHAQINITAFPWRQQLFTQQTIIIMAALSMVIESKNNRGRSYIITIFSNFFLTLFRSCLSFLFIPFTSFIQTKHNEWRLLITCMDSIIVLWQTSDVYIMGGFWFNAGIL